MPKPAEDTGFNAECAHRLDACRQALGMSKGDFCTALDIGNSRYSNWLSGAHLVPPDVVVRAKTRLGITADWVYCGDSSSLPGHMLGKVHKAAS